MDPLLLRIEQYRDGCIENTAKTVDIHKIMAARILIADDSASVRGVIREFLKDLEEVEVCGEAVDGLDAIEQAKKLKPDLVMMDLRMPLKDGIRATAEKA